jgi:hypothetical protein
MDELGALKLTKTWNFILTISPKRSMAKSNYKAAWFALIRISIFSVLITLCIGLYLEYKLSALERSIKRIKTIEVEKHIPTPKPTIINPND